MRLRSPLVVLTILCLAQLMALTLWFSANAVIPQLKTQWNLTDVQSALISIAVITGFVIGGIISAILNLPDRFSARIIFVTSAMAGSLFSMLAIGPFLGILAMVRLRSLPQAQRIAGGLR